MNTSACQGRRSHSHSHVAKLFVVLALSPPLLQLLFASDSGKVIRLLNLVVELHTVFCGPVLQEAGYCMEILQIQYIQIILSQSQQMNNGISKNFCDLYRTCEASDSQAFLPHSCLNIKRSSQK